MLANAIKTLSSASRRERLIRKTLGLPGKAPDPSGFYVVKEEGGKYYTLKSLSSTETEQAEAAWHSEDWRADIASNLAYLPQSVTRRLRGLERFANGRTAEIKLANARKLVFKSYHIHPIGACGDVEGYFDLGGGIGYRLQVVAAGAPFYNYVESEWNSGQMVTDSSNILGGDRAIYVPTDSLNEALVEEALLRWYESKFEFVRRHWTHLENAKPTLELEIEWQTQEELYGSL